MRSTSESVDTFYQELDKIYQLGDLSKVEAFLLDARAKYSTLQMPSTATAEMPVVPEMPAIAEISTAAMSGSSDIAAVPEMPALPEISTTPTLAPPQQTSNSESFEPLELAVCSELGGYYRGISRYPESIEAFGRASELISKFVGGDSYDYAVNACNLAGTYRLMADYEKSQMLYEHAMKIFKARDDTNNYYYASILNNVSLLMETMDRYEEGAAYLRESISILNRLAVTDSLKQDSPNYDAELATAYSNLASLYLKSEIDLETAPDESTDAKLSSQKDVMITCESTHDAIIDTKNTANTKSKQDCNIAHDGIPRINTQSKRHPNAAHTTNINTKTSTHPNTAHTTNINTKTSTHPNAAHTTNINTKTSTHPNTAHATNINTQNVPHPNIAQNTPIPNKSLDAARDAIAKSLAIFDRIPPNPHHAAALSTMGALCFAEGRYEEALHYNKCALVETEKYFGKNIEYRIACENIKKIQEKMNI